MRPTPVALKALKKEARENIPDIDILPSAENHLFTTNDNDDKLSRKRLYIGRFRVGDERIPLWAHVAKGSKVKYVTPGHQVRRRLQDMTSFCQRVACSNTSG
jgi:hypothetical protein